MDRVIWQLLSQRFEVLLAASLVPPEEAYLVRLSEQELVSLVTLLKTMTSPPLGREFYNHDEEIRLEGRS